MISRCAERRGDGINIQRVWCVRPLFLVLGHCAEVGGVDSDLSA